MQFEKERLEAAMKHFGENPLLRFKAEDSRRYQTARLAAGISGRTVNMETGVLAPDAEAGEGLECHFRRRKGASRTSGRGGKVLPADLKRKLFEVACKQA